jgi:NCS1 family nucleobase:cation symporter-1
MPPTDRNPPGVVVADQVGSIEQHAIDPIPPADRHGTPLELFKMWIGANINYVVVVTGSLVYAAGLDVWQSVSAILAGNLIGCSVLGLSSIMGPRTGSAGIVTSRTSFGQAGAALPMAISLVSALSWFSIQSVVATQGLEELFRLGGLSGPVFVWIALAIVLAAEIVLAVFGHATIIAAEKWIAGVLALLFAGLAVFAIQHVSADALALDPGHHANFAVWLIAVGIVLSYPIGWANFASDYSRYFPATVGWKKVALCAGGGQFVALVPCQIIGVFFAIAVHGALGGEPVSELRALLPTWFMVPFLFAIMLGGIAANVPNGYTAALGMLALRIPLSRLTSLGVIALFTLGVRIVTVYYGHFYEVYEAFLGYLVFWTTPWAAIVIVDYFLREGRYDTRALMRWGGGEYWYSRGVSWAGIMAFTVGLVASVALSNSPTFASPLSIRYVGGADLSFEAGLLLPAALYYLLARKRIPAPAGALAHER